MENGFNYMVCTQCITYNHAPYILDTLSGFVSQKTTFPVVYCVIDDASTDGEPKVLRQWAEENLVTDVMEGKLLPQMKPYGTLYFARHAQNENAYFAILLLSENHYQTGRDRLKFSYIEEWMHSSKYHALCEGDDYWIVPNKLLMQVAFLEENPDYVMCYTDFGLTDGTPCYHNVPVPRDDDYFEQAVIVDNILIGTLTVLYRSEAFYRIPKLWINKDWPMGDFPEWIELSREGKFKYLPVMTAKYRRLANSASHGGLEKELKFLHAGITIRECYAEYYGVTLTNKGYSKYFFEAASKIAYKHNNKAIAKLYKSLAVEYKMTTMRMWLFYYATVFPPFRWIIQHLKK